MKRSVSFASVLGLFVAVSAFAADLRAPFDFETTAVLPQGVRNPRFKNLIMPMDQKFGGSGGVEPLGYKLNKVVSWQDVIDGQTDPTLRAVTEGKIDSLGFSKNGAAGRTAGVVNTYANVRVPVFAVGVTPRLTMAVAIPVLDVQVNADTGFASTAEGQQLISSIREDDPEKAKEAQDKLNNSVNTKLKRLGYDEIHSTRVSNIGDVKVVGKYQTYEDSANALALKGEVTLPTGTPPNVNKALDVPTGDGQTDVGAMVIYDRYLTHDKAFKANAYAGYTVQTPDTIERRLPVSEDDSLSADKEELERDLGDIISIGTGLSYQFAWGFNMGAAYGFQHQNKVSYSGSKFPRYRYNLLETNTRQVLHSATLGVGYSTVDLFKAKQFVLPMQLNFAYCKPIKGMNVVKNELLAFEVVLFF